MGARDENERVGGRRVRFFAAATLAAVLVGACTCSKPAGPLAGGVFATDSGWRVFAVDYGRSKRFRHSAMVSDAPKGERVPMAWSAWLLTSPKRTVLVDTGFADQELADRWNVRSFEPVDRLLARAGLPAERVTDVVLTHLHWDHAGNLAPYRNARVWVQAAEREWARGLVTPAAPRKAGVRLRDLAALDAIERAGRLELLRGDREIFDGVRVHVGGKHTGATQWIEVRTGRASGTVVLSSDNAYLDENFERDVPIGSCYDREENARALAKMRAVASDPRLLIPGHEPRIFERFAPVADRIVEIE